MITSSKFYEQLNILENARRVGVSNLQSVGMDIKDNSSIPTLLGTIPAIYNKGKIDAIATSPGFAGIICAELPNVTLKLYKGESLLDTQSTSEMGGIVVFNVVDGVVGDEYTIKAYDVEDNELWTNTFELTNTLYNCKVGKPLAEYTNEEVNMAAKNDWAKYMWSVGDERTTVIMGAEKKIHIADFNLYKKADGSGYCGIVFEMSDYTNATYKHSDTSTNTLGWEGSLLRINGLAEGDEYYSLETVEEQTSGTFYIFDQETNSWVEKTLPEEYDANEYYYSKHIQGSDGAFIIGIPEWRNHIVQVETKTADRGTGFKKIITSKDRIFVPSDGEVFGNSKRYSRYSQYEQEGKQYDYYKNNFSDGKVRTSSSYLWLRSPYSSNATSFCYVSYNGYVYSDSASYGYCARLVFCI